MLALDTRLRPNEEEVTGKVMDGEAILINLATGSYYAIPDVGGVIWQAIEAHCSLEEIAARVIGGYDVSLERARRDVLELAEQLVQEHVVKVSAEVRARGEAPAPPARRSPYAPPTLTVYSDMRNLLALDPPMPTIDTLGVRRKDNLPEGSNES